MLAVPMTYHLPPSSTSTSATTTPPAATATPSSSLPASSGADSYTPSIMTPAIPPQPSSHSSSVSRPNMPCGLTSKPAVSNRPSALTRPKLTLQTTSLPMTFGSSSTGLSLSLAAGPTASPTVRNTFKNAYDVTYPSSATASPSRANNNSRFSRPCSPYTSNNPYQLPLGVKSILRNSPIDQTCRRRSNSVAPSGPNGGPGSRRVLFPSKKRVSYRYPLEEEIENVKYIARHSDIVFEPETKPREPTSSEDDDSDCSTSSLASSSDATSNTSDDDLETAASSSSSTSDKKKKKRKYRSAERQVRAVALMDGLEQDGYTSLTPQTPRQGRLKRRREWKWTLGPLEETSQNNTQSTQSPEATEPLSITASGSQIEIPAKEPNSSTATCNTGHVSCLKVSCGLLDPITSGIHSNEARNNTSLEAEHRNADPPE